MQGLNTRSFYDKYSTAMSGTRQNVGMMTPDRTTKTQTEDPKKTLGGALMAGAGGAFGGAAATSGHPAGWIGGAVVGFASYMMS